MHRWQDFYFLCRLVIFANGNDVVTGIFLVKF